MTHILDDFIFVGPKNSFECMRGLQAFLALAKFINLPLKASKTVLPTTVITVHGIEVDTKLMVARLPREKVTKALELIATLINTTYFPLRQLQSLLGLLNFCCKVIRPGRAFLRRLCDLLSGYQSCHKIKTTISLTQSACQDLLAWRIFLQLFNGIGILTSKRWQSARKLHLYTDASKIGYSLVFGSRWYGDAWNESHRCLNIMVLEFIPIVMAISVFANELANSNLIFHTDNQALVHVINNQTSKCPITMHLLRKLVVKLLCHNIYVRAFHLSSKSNLIADLISRSKFTQAKQQAPWLNKDPIHVPDHYLPPCLLRQL